MPVLPSAIQMPFAAPFVTVLFVTVEFSIDGPDSVEMPWSCIPVTMLPQMSRLELAKPPNGPIELT